jgi:uncharacterized membrane protein
MTDKVTEITEAMVVDAVTHEPVLDLDPIQIPRMNTVVRGMADSHDQTTADLVLACGVYRAETERRVSVVWSDTRDIVQAVCSRCHNLHPIAWLVPTPAGLMCQAHAD